MDTRPLIKEGGNDGIPTPTSPSSGNGNLRSRMDNLLISTTGGGRRINQKAYVFFFGLIFTATLSIYRSSYSSVAENTGDAQNLLQQQLEFAPSRLEEPNDGGATLSKVVTLEAANEKKSLSTASDAETTKASATVDTSKKLDEKADKDNDKPPENVANEASKNTEKQASAPAKKKDVPAEKTDRKKSSAAEEKVDPPGKKKVEEKVPEKQKQEESNSDKKQNSNDNKPDRSANKRKHAKGEADKQKPVEEPVEKKKPMNVVVLYADDWRHDSLGVAGKLPVHTPFLDWLAREKGIRFTHNCVTTSVCWISRATLHTGQYYSRHKATRPRDNEWYGMWEETYPALMKKLGYWVSHIGKWHSADWGKIKKTYDHQKVYYGKHWFPGNPRPIHVTERNENDAIEALQKRPKDKPFVLTVAFFAPHSWDGNPEQFLPQNKSMSLYQDITLKAPVDMEASFKRLPRKVITERNEGRTRWRQRFDEPKKYDKMLKNYFRLISEVDGACKSVWDELEAQGVLNETLFVFTTDNGFYHGEHGLAGKWYPHEESIRVPLIVYDPRMPASKRGTTDDSFTLNIDLAPTILGAAGIGLPATYQGRDISELYLKPEPSPPWRTEFFYEHPIHLHQNVIPASSALVRKDIKYIVWPNWGVEQLFNLTSDPMEEEDLIQNPKYAGIKLELKERHDKLRNVVAKANTKL